MDSINPILFVTEACISDIAVIVPLSNEVHQPGVHKMSTICISKTQLHPTADVSSIVGNFLSVSLQFQRNCMSHWKNCFRNISIDHCSKLYVLYQILLKKIEEKFPPDYGIRFSQDFNPKKFLGAVHLSRGQITMFFLSP